MECLFFVSFRAQSESKYHPVNLPAISCIEREPVDERFVTQPQAKHWVRLRYRPEYLFGNLIKGKTEEGGAEGDRFRIVPCSGWSLDLAQVTNPTETVLPQHIPNYALHVVKGLSCTNDTSFVGHISRTLREGHAPLFWEPGISSQNNGPCRVIYHDSYSLVRKKKSLKI